jgi:epoxyqueuosine reductase
MEQPQSTRLEMNDELIKFLIREFETSELNRLPESYGGGKIFAPPLIGVAQAGDPIFQKFKETLGPEHLTPLEMWLACGQDYNSVSNLSTISIIFPFDKKIRDEGINPIDSRRMRKPAEIYTIARNFGNEFKWVCILKTIKMLNEKGYDATSGMLSDAYTIVLKGKFYTTWSERYIAFASGLGTLGLHEGLITELGCNIRLGSIITNAPLKITPRKTQEPYANCLYYAKGTCKECAEKCPVNAITEKGYNKIKCNKYRMKLARKIIPSIRSSLKTETRRVNWKLKQDISIVGCELCQFGVQCTEKNPMASHHVDFFSS